MMEGHGRAMEGHGRMLEADDDGVRRALVSPTMASVALFGMAGLLATQQMGTATWGSTSAALVE